LPLGSSRPSFAGGSPFAGPVRGRVEHGDHGALIRRSLRAGAAERPLADRRHPWSRSGSSWSTPPHVVARRTSAGGGLAGRKHGRPGLGV